MSDLTDALKEYRDKLTKAESDIKLLQAKLDSAKDALKASIDLIEQYEEPRTKICGKGSVTLKYLKGVLKIISL